MIKLTVKFDTAATQFIQDTAQVPLTMMIREQQVSVYTSYSTIGHLTN
jgi:hypothetical protein